VADFERTEPPVLASRTWVAQYRPERGATEGSVHNSEDRASMTGDLGPTDSREGATATVPTSLLSESDVRDALSIDDALVDVERTYVEMYRERVLNPPKLSLQMGDDGEWPHRNAFAIDMPAYVDWCDAVGTKWAVAAWDVVTDEPINSLILLYDLKTGRFKTVMEGMYLTGIRTALQSAVGLRHLLPTQPESIGVLGAGFQAWFQLLVIDEIVDVDVFYVYDTDSDAVPGLRDRLSGHLDADIVTGETAEIVRGTDAVLTVTDSKQPVVSDELLTETPLVIPLGSYRELPDRTIIDADTIVVDHVEQCLQRGALADMVRRGELTASDIDATIGEILDPKAGRGADLKGQIVFVPIGVGALDIAIAERVHSSGVADDAETFRFS
jgi:ornithine cyclodeaminase/alanine dehydrogenase